MGLDSVELVMAIEDEFNLKIPDEKAAKLDTVGKLYQYVIENYHENPNALRNVNFETEVWEKVKKVIVYQLGVKPEQVTKQANFVYDLGMD